MKNGTDSQLRMLKKSISWWKEESAKCGAEAEGVNKDYESGLITEEEVFDRLEELGNKMDYLYHKGQYEQKNLFDFFYQLK